MCVCEVLLLAFLNRKAIFLFGLGLGRLRDSFVQSDVSDNVLYISVNKTLKQTEQCVCWTVKQDSGQCVCVCVCVCTCMCVCE